VRIGFDAVEAQPIEAEDFFEELEDGEVDLAIVEEVAEEWVDENFIDARLKLHLKLPPCPILALK
jgi:hypothetical protein